MTKRIRIMCGGLTNTIYAARRYSERSGGLIVVSTGGKEDVTREAIAAVAEHRMACTDPECRCGWSTEDWKNDLEAISAPAVEGAPR